MTRSQQGRGEVEKRAHHAGPLLDRMVEPIWGLVYPFNAILVSMDFSWPKTDNLKDPSGDFTMGRQRNSKNTKRICMLRG
jgi:hypothetical protein